jgi:molybdate transport system ATP-binding protein
LSEFPHHRIAVQATLGPLHIDAAFELTAPWTVLFGPSGSGKSSILRGICGLLPTADHTPPHRRNLAYAPQSPSIFPHLTVRENVAFALTTRNLPRHIDETLDLFALTPLAGRLPRDLSGGELQRVSLARAFAVPNATLMLLDEPFTGIDRLMRERLISVLAACNVPILSVTHDVEEALLLDAEVLRLESGRIIATGPASEVLAPELVRMRELLKP